MKKITTNLLGCLKAHTFSTWVACAYLFFVQVPRTTAIANGLYVAMAFCGLSLLLRRGFSIDWRSSLLRLIALFVVVVVMGSVSSPYWSESLGAIRRELIPLVLVFLLLTSQRVVKEGGRQIEVATLAAWSLIYAFVTRTFLALADWLAQGVHTDYYSIDRSVARFFNFYAIDASLIMPVVVAAFLYLAMSRSNRILLLMSLVVCTLLVLISSVRTALVAVVLVTFLQFIAAPRLNKLWLGVGIVILALGMVVMPTNRLERVIQRSASVFTQEAYIGSESTGASSVYERLSIWSGAIEMVKDRPLLGYGLGWQKFYDAGYDGGYVARWRKSNEFIDRTVANYFDVHEKGQVNPHNLWVQVLFETGGLGLLSYIAILVTLLCRAVHAVRAAADTKISKWFGGATLAYLLSYVLVNMMGGFWLLSGATLMLLVVSELLYQRQRFEDKAH